LTVLAIGNEIVECACIDMRADRDLSHRRTNERLALHRIARPGPSDGPSMGSTS